MEFRFLVFLLLVGVVFADEEDQCEREIEKCRASYRQLTEDEPSEKQACSRGKTFISCLREGLKNCGSEEGVEGIDFEELENVYNERCPDSGMSEESKECFKNNENFIKGCLEETMGVMTEFMFQNQDLDENVILCLSFTGTKNCVLERIEEKCGSEAKEQFEEENDTVPAEVYNACTAESTLEYLANVLLEDRRKRK